MTEKNETNPTRPKFKVNDRVRITMYRNSFRKVYTENWSRKIFIIDSGLKNSPLRYEIKDLNGKKIIGSFHEKELLRGKLYFINQTAILNIKSK